MAQEPPGVGIDLLEIDRLERALERRPHLAQRLFTDAERAYADSRARPAQHLAGRFCAKESVAKALGLPAWNFRDVEVVDTGGPPEVRLHGAVAERARALRVRVSVSITHSRRDAAAVAIASPEENLSQKWGAWLASAGSSGARTQDPKA